MFCNNCGKELQAGDQFCRACGQPIGVAPIPTAHNRVAQNVHLLGIFWLVYGLLELIGGIVIVSVAQVIFGFILRSVPMNGPPPPAFIGAIITGVGIFVLAKGALSTAAGVGLMQRQSWARILSIVMAFISLLNIPFGLALGIYTLYVFLPEGSAGQYEALVRT